MVYAHIRLQTVFLQNVVLSLQQLVFHSEREPEREQVYIERGGTIQT